MTPAAQYTILETLSGGGRAIVHRARRDADDHPVILKVLDPRRSGPKEIEQLRREYELGTLFDTPAVVRPLALETYQGMPALVLEDEGADSLDGLLGEPMPMDRFLPVAIRIAGAVAEIHAKDIIHKDLKPQNILVSPASGEVKITDFGLASRLPREHRPTQPARLIEGSLPYLAPEQTGRVNRAIDSRADLYSLGVTFFQMLTGRLPFEANDPVEWVHCHVAYAPPSASEVVPEVPEAVAQIVLKLLSKTPEDRYQGAGGLRRDLERCLAEWTQSGTIEPFTPGEHDVSDQLQIPQKLYGRDAEIAVLKEAFDRVVATGTPELVLVSGYSGIGKSGLVHEIEAPVVRAGGFFISGKFDQYKRDIPYATLVQAFRELVRWILAESEEQIAAWRRLLLDAFGINAQLIVDVIPEVALAIGRPPPAPELPPVEAQNRFRMVFQRFIGVFARHEHPLALFLDDLQWADSASLALLQEILTHAEVRDLLVIGAYRDNEVSAAHPLMRSLSEVRQAGARVSDIVLGPIPPAALAKFVGEALHCPVEDAAPLAELIQDKTAGNPFFAIQFLTALHEERLIERDERSGRFRWDVARIREKGFTDNVVDLMVAKLRRLPPATQEALKQLACLGNTAEVALLAMIHDGLEEGTRADLWEAIRAGLVLDLDGKCKFLHDRVQEAAYSLVSEEQRAAEHLRIGRFLASRLPQDAIAERIFDVANQWNRGAHLLTDPREKEALCRLDFLAGTKAKAAIAYASAQSYLAQASRLLPEDAWSRQYEDTFSIHLDLAECEYLIGDFERAEELFGLILARARSPLDCAKAHRLRLRLYQIAGRLGDAVSTMFEAVRLFGVTFPESEDEIQAAVEVELQRVPILLRGRAIADLALAPTATDERVRAVIGLLVEAMAPTYSTRPAYWPLVIAKALSFSLQYGNCEESAFVYSCYAALLVSRYGNISWGCQFSEMALRLNERFDGLALKGRLLFHHAALACIWRMRFATLLPMMEQAHVACFDVGDFVFAGYASFNLVWLVVESGGSIEQLIEASRKYASSAEKSHHDLARRLLRTEEQFAASLKGATRAPTSFNDDTYDEVECVLAMERAGFGIGVAFFHIMKQVAAFIDGRYAEARQAAALAAPMLREVMALANEATHHFYYALTLTAMHADAPAVEQRQFAELLEVQLRKLSFWAEHCAENFQNRYALVQAEVARIEGRHLDAERLFEEAIRSARDNGFVHNEAVAYEVASRFYRARGLEEFADLYLRNARACYARWGAHGKVRQLDRQNPHLVERRFPPPTATVAVDSDQLDLSSVTKASQTISGEIVLDELLRTLLRIVLEQGGAERACLLLCQDQGLSIEAEASLGERGATTTLLGSEPLDGSLRVPASLIHYANRTKERVILSDAAAHARKFAGDGYFARSRPRSVLCMPILRQAEVVGLLYLENNLLAGAFTPDRLAALELLATQAAISLENARLLAKERTARTAAEEAERRSAFLAEAGVVLSESLDYEVTFARLGEFCVQTLADWCSIDIVEDGELRRLAGAHGDPEKAPVLKELQLRYPPRWGSPHPSITVLRTGEPLLMPELPDEILRTMCVDDEHLRLLRELGTRTRLSVPLAVRGQRLGALTLSSGTPGRRYGRADLELAQEVAHRAAIAIDNARLYRASQEAVRARSEFLSVATHELNTPLTSLTLSVQSLRRAVGVGRPVDPQVMDQRLERVSRQTTRLTRLINDLLDVSRIESRPRALELSDVDLGALVRAVAARFEADLARARCSISIRGDGPVVGCWDRSRLDQVVTNLLGNAIKFGAGKPIEIVVGAENGVARLAVRDHGIGIDPAECGRIFERFERAVSERHYGGLGLGLYISRKIVEDHGGSIRCNCQPGAGATFIVELPCAGPVPPPPAA
ncbi:AAA family ATPase [Sorangium sp. So ce1000]|uniref:AAA family ATPase n=1 Tax=Sorangium sp. So ce1000 TaxID=3133325 RepID=UPI003F62111F